MIKEAIDRLLELARPETVDVGGLTYWTNTHGIAEPPRPGRIEVQSLTGLVDFLQHGLGPTNGEPNKIFVHIVEPTRVELILVSWEGFYSRQILARAVPPQEPARRFEAGLWTPLEDFVIFLQAQFVDVGARAELLHLLGSITDEQATTSHDDGVTQKVTARAGVALMGSVKVPNPVSLAPFRTFPDIEQPLSPFIVRIRGGEQKTVALFEADGGLWRLAALKSIEEFLEGTLPSGTDIIC